MCPDLEFIIDGTEHPIRRPKDKAKQKEYYSGKKGCHTVKNNVVSERSTKKMKVLSTTCEGKNTIRSWLMNKRFPFQKAAKSGRILAFKGTNPKVSPRINP
jgi:hypothetical protein